MSSTSVAAVEQEKGPPSTAKARRPAWLSQHLGTAIALAVGGYLLGHYLGNVIGGG